MEDLINHRFSFLLVFAGVLVAPLLQAKAWQATVLSAVAGMISLVLLITLERAQSKFDHLFEQLKREYPSHPASATDRHANMNSASARGGISRCIPTIIVGTFLLTAVMSGVCWLAGEPSGSALAPQEGDPQTRNPPQSTIARD